MYLFECTVCGVEYVGSTYTPFEIRFNNHKACSRKFNSVASEPLNSSEILKKKATTWIPEGC